MQSEKIKLQLISLILASLYETTISVSKPRNPSVYLSKQKMVRLYETLFLSQKHRDP